MCLPWLLGIIDLSHQCRCHPLWFEWPGWDLAWTEKLHLTILPCILRIQLPLCRRSEDQCSWDCWFHGWCHLRQCKEGILYQISAAWGHLSSTAISHAYHTVHSDSGLHIVADFKKLHASALFYFMAVREFEPLCLHTEIIIEDEVQNQHLDPYDAYCHSSIFPPHDRRKVTTMVIDVKKWRCSAQRHLPSVPDVHANQRRRSATTPMDGCLDVIQSLAVS